MITTWLCSVVVLN